MININAAVGSYLINNGLETPTLEQKWKCISVHLLDHSDHLK